MYLLQQPYTKKWSEVTGNATSSRQGLLKCGFLLKPLHLFLVPISLCKVWSCSRSANHSWLGWIVPFVFRLSQLPFGGTWDLQQAHLPLPLATRNCPVLCAQTFLPNWAQVLGHGNTTCSEGKGERPSSQALCLLVVSSGPAHSGRIPRPHPTTSCVLTSWRPLALSRPHRPPPTPGPRLYPELQVGLRRRSWGLELLLRAGPSASPLNGPFQSKSLFSQETLGFFPAISSRWQCCSTNPIPTLPTGRPLPPVGREKNVTRDKCGRKYGFLPSCPVWRTLLTLSWFCFWFPSAITLGPKPTPLSGFFSVQELNFHLPSRCPSTFSSLSTRSPVFSVGTKLSSDLGEQTSKIQA